VEGILLTKANATNLTLDGGGDAEEVAYAISLYLPSQTHPYLVDDNIRKGRPVYKLRISMDHSDTD
jgi:hypothetical protein